MLKTRPGWFISILLVAILCTSSCGLLADDQPVSIPRNNTLTLFDTGPITLDPAMSQDSGSHSYVVQIFSGLVALDGDMQSVGDIAETWETGEDGRVDTFHLRQDVTFHDGTPVTAGDFKYSWERACRPETGSPTAPTYLGDIVGVQDMLSGDAGEIEGVRVIDDYTLEVTIDAPKAYFLAKLTYPVAMVIDSAEAGGGGEWWRTPNGTGPFKLKEWVQDELVLLQRNDLYYGDKAKVDYVAFLLWGGTPMQMYELGEIDVTSVYLSDLDRVMDEDNPLHQELQVLPEMSLSYIGFDTTRPPFDDVLVRQAFCHATDRESLVTQLLGDAVTLADGILPPGMPGYTGQTVGLEYDVELARTLMSDAGYGGGEGLSSIMFETYGEGGGMASWLTSVLWQWSQDLGVSLEVTQLETEAYFYRLDDQEYDMFVFGWIADYPDPQDFLELLFHSDSVNNYGGYSNAEVDLLLEQAAVEQDDDVRLDLYRQAEQIIISDAACIPLWFDMQYLLVKPYVKGYTLNPLGVPWLANVSLEK